VDDRQYAHLSDAQRWAIRSFLDSGAPLVHMLAREVGAGELTTAEAAQVADVLQAVADGR
jgi:hypothetical protein